jgi:ferredoxin-NADP reductase
MSTDIEVSVVGLRVVARDVLAVELRHKSGQALPGAQAGAHIDLALGNGLVRQYSLVNAIGQTSMNTFVVAVGWDANSRGGSVWIHEKLKVGQSLRISAPRNLFEMAPEHRRVLLLAGGIGITPIYAMVQTCVQQGLDFELWASARSAPRLAYLEELKALAGNRLVLHFDDEQGGPIDLAGRLQDQRWDAVYACGPAPMLDALIAATAHWTPGSVRMERFKGADVPASERQLFQLTLQTDRKFNRHPGSISAPVTHRQLENCPQSLIAPCNNRCPTLPEARNTPSVGRIAGLGQERSRRAAFAAVRYHAIR